MRKVKRPKFGDYLLFARWADKDLNDPWYIGFLETIIESENSIRYMAEGSKRQWRHVFKITPEEASQRFAEYNKQPQG